MEIFLLAGMLACAKSFDIDEGNILECLDLLLLFDLKIPIVSAFFF